MTCEHGHRLCKDHPSSIFARTLCDLHINDLGR